MIICKSPAPPDDHLQEAGPSGSSFSRGQPLWMTICKRPVPPRMIVCKSLAPGSKLWHPLESNWKCIDHTCNQDATNSPWSYNATNDKDIHCNHLCVYNSFMYLCGICILHSSVSWLCSVHQFRIRGHLIGHLDSDQYLLAYWIDLCCHVIIIL